MQAAKVVALGVPYAVLVAFCEEHCYRGFLPLILAAKGLPNAAVVGLSAFVFGVRNVLTIVLDLIRPAAKPYFMVHSNGREHIPFSGSILFEHSKFLEIYFWSVQEY